MSALRTLLVKNDAIKNLIRRSYHAGADFKRTTMNDMPTPNGSWKKHYDSRNSKYNMHLLLGVAFLGVTILTAKTSGLVYLNYYPPSRPE